MLPSLLLCTSIFVISLTCPNYWMSSLPNTAFAMPTFPPDCLVRQLTPLLWANRINYLRTNPLYRSILTPFLPEKLPDLITYRRLLEYQRRCNDTARTPILLRACWSAISVDSILKLPLHVLNAAEWYDGEWDGSRGSPSHAHATQHTSTHCETTYPHVLTFRLAYGSNCPSPQLMLTLSTMLYHPFQISNIRARHSGPASRPSCDRSTNSARQTQHSQCSHPLVPYGTALSLSRNHHDILTSAPSHCDNINHTASITADNLHRQFGHGVGGELPMITTFGFWNSHDKATSINVRELKAVYYALKMHAPR
jgi:hypothetical protein